MCINNIMKENRNVLPSRKTMRRDDVGKRKTHAKRSFI
jgi:hypothetical protein